MRTKRRLLHQVGRHENTLYSRRYHKANEGLAACGLVIGWLAGCTLPVRARRSCRRLAAIRQQLPPHERIPRETRIKAPPSALEGAAVSPPRPWHCSTPTAEEKPLSASRLEDVMLLRSPQMVVVRLRAQVAAFLRTQLEAREPYHPVNILTHATLALAYLAEQFSPFTGSSNLCSLRGWCYIIVRGNAAQGIKLK